MHLEQLNLTYLSNEDRILLRIGFFVKDAEQEKQEIQLFFTRRMLQRLWPTLMEADSAPGRGPTRTVGSTVVLVNGALAAYIASLKSDAPLFPAPMTIARAASPVSDTNSPSGAATTPVQAPAPAP